MSQVVVRVLEVVVGVVVVKVEGVWVVVLTGRVGWEMQRRMKPNCTAVKTPLFLVVLWRQL